MRRALLASTLIVGVLLAGGVPSVVAAERPVKVELSAIGRFGGDANGDAALDPASLWPRGVSSDLRTLALRARIADARCGRGAKVDWTVDGGAPVPGGCQMVFTVTSGGHDVDVGLAGATGHAHIKVEARLVVALGDSVASGEGNAQHGWLEPRCHRSAVAGFEQAVRLLSNSDPTIGVTFVSLACSGATVARGLIGSYEGIVPGDAKGNLEAQVRRLGRIDGRRKVDAVLISVGANDIHFSGVVVHCFVHRSCPSARFDPAGTGSTLDADAVEERALGALAGEYDRLAADLSKNRIDPRRVLLSEYFDPTRAAGGVICDGIFPLNEISQDELAWAHDRVLAPLNASGAAAAGRHRWRYIGGVASSFAGHGYCVGGAQGWVRSLGRSVLEESGPLGHRADGTLHPNAAGHLAIAEALAPVLAQVLGMTEPARQSRTRTRIEWLLDNLRWVALAVVALLILIALIEPLRTWGKRFWFLVGSSGTPDPVRGPITGKGRGPPASAPEPRSPGVHVARLGLGLAAFVLVVALVFGFSWVIGAAILFVRAWAARFPADQALEAVGRDQMAVVGAQALAIFLVLGAGAVLVLYIIDPQGRAKRPTRRGLALLVTLELVVAILLGGFGARQALWLAAGFIVAAILLHFLIDRCLAVADPLRDPGPTWSRLFGGARRSLGRLFPTIDRSGRLRWPLWLLQKLWQLAPFILLAFALHHAWRERFLSDRLVSVLLPVLAAATLFVAPWAAAGTAKRAGDPKLQPVRVALALALVACFAGFLAVDEAWLLGAAAAAIVLSALCLGVAHVSGRQFAPFGVTIMLSVGLYGAALAALRTIDSPKAQPVAILGPGSRAACGLYVGEHDGRIWLVHLELSERGSRRRPAPRRSRLSSVPRADDVDVALGPLQPVGRAQAQAAMLLDTLRREHGQPVDTRRATSCEPAKQEDPPVLSRERTIARRVQPELVVDRRDGFWPVPVKTIFAMEDRRARVCRRVADGVCVRLNSAADLPWAGGAGEWLDYPSDGLHADDEHDVMVDALGSTDPDRTAMVYYLTSRGRTATSPWTVQFWFFYTFNYQPTTLRLGWGFLPKQVRDKLVVQPNAVRGGYHEGDFEMVSLLLSAKSHRPVYAWMARHKDEGRAYVWGEPGLQTHRRHMTVYAAKGSHANYATCVSQPRPVAPYGVIDDQPQCKAEQQLRLAPESTRLSDLSRVPWACWQGYFGQLPQQARERVPYQSDHGPRSPFWQQTFGGKTYEPCRGTRYPFNRAKRSEEVLGPKAAGLLRARAGRLDPVVDECADWEHPPRRGVLMVACEPRRLARFRASGYEYPGGPTVHIDVAEPDKVDEGPTTIPALRRDATVKRLDSWRIATLRPAITTVYAACATGKRNWAVQARFQGVHLVPGEALQLIDGPGDWRLVSVSGSTITAKPAVVAPKGTKPKDVAKGNTRCGAGA